MTTETTATTITAEHVIALLAGDLRAEAAIYLCDDGEIVVSHKVTRAHAVAGRDYVEIIDNQTAYDWMRGDDSTQWETLDEATQRQYASELAASLREDLAEAADRLDRGY